MRPGNIRGSGHRARLGGEPGRLRSEQVGADDRQAGLLQRPDEHFLLDTKLVTSDTVIPASLTTLAALADLWRTGAVSLQSGRVGCRGESE